ncbi:putative metal-binding motif-containing protein [Polyangium mundeleinium]|uniref:Metal-binding motif-containing protein n=1 Tax=Polyangium mundeleinium TaxID=2995306 RepID=A0ABT5F5H0_9BACT|nr:putative metal-binding motif-containing protein [Polyangium mundeleinium]MDC0748346.1 putative metal-binding motif-containing protein [Polyangium mundeleinium]
MTSAETKAPRPRLLRHLRWITALLPVAALASACGPSTAPNPFTLDAGPDGATDPDGGTGGGAGGGNPDDGGTPDDTLGGPCNDDAQCDDAITCTVDVCDTSIARCRHSPDDAACQDGVYCDGVERCAPKLGCLPGPPVACSDGDVCTIDTCVESTGACTHVLRDADGDGVPDGHCIAKGDCNDDDPKVSPALPEVCANGKDDDCDGAVDEADCASPKHDTCTDPLVIDAPGAYTIDTTAAAANFAASCNVNNQPAARDVVAAIVLPAGPPVDVEITARTNAADVAIALLGQCGDPSTEITCGTSFFHPQGGRFAKIRGRGLGDPAKTTALPLYVFADADTPVILDVAFLPPEPVPTNETCGTAEPISFGVPFFSTLVDAATDVGITCTPLTGELLYSFELASPANVHVYASSVDGDGFPVISLRDAACALPENEITCKSAPIVDVFRHALPAGTYHVAVAAGAPTIVSTTVVIEPPTEPLPDETCEGAPAITPNVTRDVDLLDRQDDVKLGCLPGAVDAAYTLSLPVASDVLLVQRISQGDTGAVTLALPACADPSDQLICDPGSQSPLRIGKRNIPAGDYRVVAESLLGQPAQVTAFVRKTTPPLIVPFADACADVLMIPSTGGFFQGNTANATANFNAGCDQGGGPEGGARDQLLGLSLSDKKRVVLDMGGSGYTTLLDVRKGPDCPGVEVPKACAVGYGQNKSFLDLTLDPGTYFLQIDGLGQDSGPWFLDVRIVDP